jgi:hypothetical protein
VADFDDPPRHGAIFLRAIGAALARVPLWLLCWALSLFLAAGLAVPFGESFARATENRYEPGSLLASLDANFRADHGDEFGASGATAAFLGVIAFLGGIFAAGGWLQVFLERTEGHSLRRFLWGGARYFWRFLRVAVLTILALACVSWLLHGWPWKATLHFLCGARDGDLEVLHSEWSAVLVGWLQAGVHALLFALVLAWGDYTRTRLALNDTRSALWAGLQSVFLLLRYPVRALRPLVLILAVEIAFVALLGKLSWSVNVGLGPDSGWASLALLFVLGQLALIGQVIARGARYAAAVQVSRGLVPPVVRDSWGDRIGGPGGPQYPIDDTGEYGVSI